MKLFKLIKSTFLFAFFLLISLLLFNCNDRETDNETARVQLVLVDAPGDYEEVNVEIIDIQYNSSEGEKGWKSFTPENGYPIQVDLTKLIAGNDLLLTDEIIPAGTFKQIRLILSDNNTLLLEGETTPVHLDTPSAEQSGLKIKLDENLEGGYSYTFILDWDVQRSVVKAGNSGKYILKPVIRANAEVNSGTLGGQVVADPLSDDDNITQPLANVVVSVYTLEGVLVTQTQTNDLGNFLIHGLKAGEYKIQISTDTYMPYESAVVNIVAGEVTDLGIIELKVPVS
jgi:hypothetical protein